MHLSLRCVQAENVLFFPVLSWGNYELWLQCDKKCSQPCRVNLEWKLTSSSKNWGRTVIVVPWLHQCLPDPPVPWTFGSGASNQCINAQSLALLQSNACRNRGAKCRFECSRSRSPCMSGPTWILNSSTYDLIGFCLSKHCPLQCHPESDLAIGWSEGIKYLALKIAIAVALSCTRDETAVARHIGWKRFWYPPEMDVYKKRA